MAVFNKIVDVQAVSDYPEDAQIEVPFPAKQVILLNESASDTIWVSFDGVTDHVRLTPGGPSAGILIEQAVKAIWAKAAGSPSGATELQVIVTDAPR